MALPSSGSLRFSQLESEFGRNGKRSLGNYRVSEDIGELTNLPLDSGIPQSGQIKFSDFFGKRLNAVVNYYNTSTGGPGAGGASTRYRVDGRRKWNNRPEDVRCVGGFRTRPSSSSGTKVMLHVTLTIGSEKSSNRRVVAFRTGSWDSGTQLQIDVGGSGRIIGAGGNGGQGADNENEGGGSGSNGTSAIGLAYPATINVFPGGIVAGGGGGGGGGGGAYDTDKNDDELASGGGGGGGAGIDSGNGGRGGDSWEADGSAGSNGSTTGGGSGGNGGEQDGEARGGRGGDGGGLGSGGGSGQGGSGEHTSGGGSGGSSGFWIVSGGHSYSLNNSGTVSGPSSSSSYS